jgi:adenylate cyclase
VGDPVLLLQAHTQFGLASLNLGEPTVALEHLDKGTVLDDPELHRSHAFVPALYPGVFCLGGAALTLWLLGHPDRALKRSDEALALARKIDHPFSLAWALFFAAWLHGLRREWPMAAERAEATVALCAEKGFAQFLLVGTCRLGEALIELGRIEEGIAQMRDALAAMPSHELFRPYHLALLAMALGKAGRPDDALTQVAEALALTERSDERWWEGDIYRVRGELLLECGGSSEAEACFRHAVEIARRQSAKSLELRATTSLARLLDKQGSRDEARRMLGEIYGWFTEGFDTADLEDAKALHDALS